MFPSSYIEDKLRFWNNQYYFDAFYFFAHRCYCYANELSVFQIFFIHAYWTDYCACSHCSMIAFMFCFRFSLLLKHSISRKLKTKQMQAIHSNVFKLQHRNALIAILYVYIYWGLAQCYLYVSIHWGLVQCYLYIEGLIFLRHTNAL